MIGTITSNAAIQVVTFFTSVVTAHLLGSSGRGDLALIYLYPQFIASICLFGVDKAIAIHAGQKKIGKPFEIILFWTTVLSVPGVLMALFAINTYLTKNELIHLAYIYTIYIPAFLFNTLTSLYLNGVGNFFYFNSIKLSFYITNLILLLTVLLFDFNGKLIYVAFISILSTYVVTFFSVLILVKGNKFFIGGNSPKVSLIKDAYSFVFPSFISIICAYSYQLVMSVSDTPANLIGNFIILFTYSRLPSFFGAAMASHMFFLSISSENKLLQMLNSCYCSNILLAVFLLALAPLFFPILFGNSFEVNYPILIALFFSGYISNASDLISEFLKGKRLISSISYGYIAYIAILFLFGFSIIEKYSIIGLALIILCAEFIRLFILVIHCSAVLKIPFSNFIAISFITFSSLLNSYIHVLFSKLKK